MRMQCGGADKALSNLQSFEVHSCSCMYEAPLRLRTLGLIIAQHLEIPRASGTVGYRESTNTPFMHSEVGWFDFEALQTTSTLRSPLIIAEVLSGHIPSFG